MENLDLLKITATHHIDLKANAADLHLTIKGSNLIIGNAVLEKSKEINQLVNDLQAAEIVKTNIHLQSVQADIASGLLSKTTSASYNLLIKCPDLEKLSKAIAILSAQRNISINSVEWKYDESPEIRLKGLADCATLAAAKANSIANALNIKLNGVHRVSDTILETVNQPHQNIPAQSYVGRTRSLGAAGGGPGRGGMVAPEEFNFALVNWKRLEFYIEIEYKIGN